MAVPPRRLLVPVLGIALSLLPSSGRAQTTARPTGFFFRAGPTLTSFDPSELQFLGSRATSRTPATFTGKDLQLESTLLPGFTVGVDIDAAWFFARVGVDFYGAPDVRSALSVTADRTHVLWGAAGARFAFGPVAVLAGVHLGALLMSVEQKVPEGAPRQYGAVEGIYAGMLGVQWRPLRWLEIDASFAQDLGTTQSTIGSLAVNIGWSRAW